MRPIVQPGSVNHANEALAAKTEREKSFNKPISLSLSPLQSGKPLTAASHVPHKIMTYDSWHRKPITVARYLAWCTLLHPGFRPRNLSFDSTCHEEEVFLRSIPRRIFSFFSSLEEEGEEEKEEEKRGVFSSLPPRKEEFSLSLSLSVHRRKEERETRDGRNWMVDTARERKRERERGKKSMGITVTRMGQCVCNL